MNLREDVMMAARAAVWARAISLWSPITGPRREELLRVAAAFLAHLRAGAVEVQGDIPRGEVHPWECYLGYTLGVMTIKCGEFELYPHGKVPKAAVEAALSELRSHARAAGAVIWTHHSIVRPATPDLVRKARAVVSAARAKLNSIDHGTTSVPEWLHMYDVSGAAALAAIEAGNWIVEVEPSTYYPDVEYDLSQINILASYGVARIRTHDDNSRIVNIHIFAARPPRSMRDAFATAYAKWHKRAAAAALVEALERV
ncbi:MAG: hypothetical protein RXR82_07595 [Nitrososphaeria archaeon]